MSALYANAREQFLTAQLNWPALTVKVLLVASTYTPQIQTHQHVSDIPPAAIVARSPTVTGLSASAGVASAGNVTFPSVTGPTATYAVLYQDTGSDATSPLIALIDTANGLPVTPNGGPVTIAWDTGPNHVFAL